MQILELMLLSTGVVNPTLLMGGGATLLLLVLVLVLFKCESFPQASERAPQMSNLLQVEYKIHRDDGDPAVATFFFRQLTFKEKTNFAIILPKFYNGDGFNNPAQLFELFQLTFVKVSCPDIQELNLENKNKAHLAHGGQVVGGPDDDVMDAIAQGVGGMPNFTHLTVMVAAQITGLASKLGKS